jgi:hypothetical protein
MRIHENPIIEQIAVETIASMQLGMNQEIMEAIIETYEESEEYEKCLGIQLGIEYYNTKQFGCTVAKVYQND